MPVQKIIIKKLFTSADITFGGDRPWDIQVYDERFYNRVLMTGSLGLGEAYIDGWWTSADLEESIFRLIKSGLHRISEYIPTHLIRNITDRFTNQQTKTKSKRVAERHYNFGNDLYCGFLGKYKNYSCGYFENTDDLDQAQLNKMAKICEEMDFQAGETVLDVGGGWGEIARYVASNFGSHITSINISDEQIKHAREYCADYPVDTIKMDYRDLSGKFDKVMVIAMMTHVGVKNYRPLIEKAHACLKDGGTAIIETIGRYKPKRNCEPWTDKYLFPGGMMPAMSQITAALDGLFVTEKVTEFGLDYQKTARAWHYNFMGAWPDLKQRYPDKVRLIYEYYFLCAAAGFRSRELLHWHIVLKKC